MTGLSTVATAEPHTLVKEHEKVRKVGEERRDKFNSRIGVMNIILEQDV